VEAEDREERFLTPPAAAAAQAVRMAQEEQVRTNLAIKLALEVELRAAAPRVRKGLAVILPQEVWVVATLIRHSQVAPEVLKMVPMPQLELAIATEPPAAAGGEVKLMVLRMRDQAVQAGQVKNGILPMVPVVVAGVVVLAAGVQLVVVPAAEAACTEEEVAVALKTLLVLEAPVAAAPKVSS
jgi:hypothetical protein